MAKAIVVYYSYSNNTHKAAGLLKKELDETSYQTQLLRLEPTDETNSFLGQCKRAFLKKQAVLKEGMSFDVADCDVIAFGTPVWAFAMAPALRTYLNACRGLTGKKVILFVTCGSGAGVGNCIREMVSIVKAKGASDTRSFIIPQAEIHDQKKAITKIRESLKQWL